MFLLSCKILLLLLLVLLLFIFSSGFFRSTDSKCRTGGSTSPERQHFLPKFWFSGSSGTVCSTLAWPESHDCRVVEDSTLEKNHKESKLSMNLGKSMTIKNLSAWVRGSVLCHSFCTDSNSIYWVSVKREKNTYKHVFLALQWEMAKLSQSFLEVAKDTRG